MKAALLYYKLKFIYFQIGIVEGTSTPPTTTGKDTGIQGLA